MSLLAAIERLQQADQALSDADPTPFPLPVAGLEAVIVGAVLALERGDWWVPGLRERVGAVLRDVPLERLIDGLQGAKPYWDKIKLPADLAHFLVAYPQLNWEIIIRRATEHGFKRLLAIALLLVERLFDFALPEIAAKLAQSVRDAAQI